LEHLEGKTVDVLADGFVSPPQTVTRGCITLPNAATRVHVGLNYSSTIMPLEPQIVLQTGSTLGKTKRISRVFLQFYNSNGMQAGTKQGAMESVAVPDDILDGRPALYSGDVAMEFEGGFVDSAQVVIQQDEPLPMTVLGYSMQLEIGER
ncbi:MAG: hypothetical protein MI717_14570, partial [Spirochaetales bacterium]|nr:hypothetical protein [Spirochaetales bacterium]